MRTNSFYCPVCGKNTRHHEISLQEVAAKNSEEEKAIRSKIRNKLSEYSGAAFDLIRIPYLGNLTKIYEAVTGEIPYKCEECLVCSWRNSRGEDVGLVSSDDVVKVITDAIKKGII